MNCDTWFSGSSDVSDGGCYGANIQHLPEGTHTTISFDYGGNSGSVYVQRDKIANRIIPWLVEMNLVPRACKPGTDCSQDWRQPYCNSQS